MVLEANLFKITYFELKLTGSVENKYAAWLKGSSSVGTFREICGSWRWRGLRMFSNDGCGFRVELLRQKETGAGGRNVVSSLNITCGGVNSHTERDTASNNHIRGNRQSSPQLFEMDFPSTVYRFPENVLAAEK